MKTKKDRKIKGLKLIGWQKEFAKVFEGLEPNDKLVIKASRQKGKSTVLCQALLYCALNHSYSHSYFISPTNDQCRKQFNDLRDCCSSSPLVSKMNESTQEIRFTNGSCIFFKSAEAGEHLRGNTVKRGGILCIDEGAFIKDDTISILLPYVTVSKAPIVIISTPRRKNGTFYSWYIKAKQGDKGYKCIDVNDYDNSFFITPEQIEDYRKIMSKEKFKNEILGLFSDSNEGVFGDFQSAYKEPEDLEPVYCGIDFSTTGSDFTVMSFFNQSKEQCMIWKDNSVKDPVKRCEMMADILNSYPSLRIITAETNSMGSVYISLLKRLLIGNVTLKEFTTTNESKKRVVEQVIEKLGNKEITLLYDTEQDYEFSIFSSIELGKGNYTYAADPKNQAAHDDLILALCFAVDSFSGSSGNYMISVSRGGPIYKHRR